MPGHFGQDNFAPPADLADALINARIAIETCKAAGTEITALSYTTSPRFMFFETDDLIGDTLGFDDGSGTLGGILAGNF